MPPAADDDALRLADRSVAVAVDVEDDEEEDEEEDEDDGAGGAFPPAKAPASAATDPVATVVLATAAVGATAVDAGAVVAAAAAAAAAGVAGVVAADALPRGGEVGGVPASLHTEWCGSSTALSSSSRGRPGGVGGGDCRGGGVYVVSGGDGSPCSDGT